MRLTSSAAWAFWADTARSTSTSRSAGAAAASGSGSAFRLLPDERAAIRPSPPGTVVPAWRAP